MKPVPTNPLSTAAGAPSPTSRKSCAKTALPSTRAEHHIPRVQVHLTPGDLYFFCTENIHEVERLTRQRRRVVLAFFFAMSADKSEIFVWS